MLIPDWIAAEIAVGRTELQQMLDTTTFDRAAVRTVATTGDFEVVDGHVRFADSVAPGTWFPQREPSLSGRWSLPVQVTAELLDDATVPVPLAVGAIAEVYRLGHRSLDSRLGPQAMLMDNSEVQLGSITRFLTDLGAGIGDTVHLHFDTAGGFDVTR